MLPFVLLPLVAVLVHLVPEAGYGYFRDELYYLACAKRLAWGYVDHPPLSVAALRVWVEIFGDSRFAIRLLPALLGGVTVLVTGLLTRTLGGGRFAAALAMLCVLIVPEYLAVNGYYSMNTFDLFFWAVAAWVLVLILHRGHERLWPLLGLVLGLGLLNKISVLWLGLGLGVGFVLGGARRRLTGSGPWIAAGIALLLFLPHLLWQMQHDWATLEFIRNATGEKMRAISPVAFARSQIENQHPFTFPVWLAGLGFALFAVPGRAVRPLGIAYLVVFVLLVVNGKSRSGYLSPAYPMLYAFGAVWLERWTRDRRSWLRPVALVLLAVGGAITAPLVLPILPPEAYARYAARLGEEPSTAENKELGTLPQFFADRTGWSTLVDKVEAAFNSLTPEERAHTAIYASNYGEAGAIEVLGGRRGLPQPVSGHNNYWWWGWGDREPDIVIVVGEADSEEGLRQRFANVEDRGAIDCPYCMPYERDSKVFLCRGLKAPMRDVWPRTRHYN